MMKLNKTLPRHAIPPDLLPDLFPLSSKLEKSSRPSQHDHGMFLTFIFIDIFIYFH